MKRCLVAVVTACVAILSLQAQVINWAVLPGEYTKIEPCWGDMYLVHKGNDLGVINGDGKIIVSPEATRITGFYGGYALVLQSDNGQERIVGILSTDGSYSKVDGTYYTIPYQEFFSEGLLTVTNAKGKAGYMNVNGAIVKDFKVSFVSPFSEGYAVVGENEEYTIVDKRFNALSIQLGTVSQVYGGSNVYNGIAVIWDGNGRFYNFDVNKRTCKKISEPSSLDYDYMYCFSCITKRPETVPYDQPNRSPLTLAVAERGNRYGYVNNEKVVLPYQFEQAESFYGNYAIVKSEGRYALLSLHNTGGTFGAKADSDIKYRKSSDKNLTHKFNVFLPESWTGKDVSIKLKDENGMPVSIANNRGSCEFKSDGATGTKRYTVEIDADGLKLWNGEIAYNYQIEKEPETVIDGGGGSGTGLAKLSVSLKAANTQADKNNHCCIKATISNSNATPVTTKVQWSGSSLLEGANTTVTVPANGKTVVDIYLNVKKAISGQHVTVTTSAGGSATIEGLQLIPF